MTLMKRRRRRKRKLIYGISGVMATMATGDLLCNESSETPGAVAGDWPWRDWSEIRRGITEVLLEPPDFFRRLDVRKHFLWLIKWFSSGPLANAYSSACPIGVLTLHMLTLLACNDADRCIQLRDNRLGVELLGADIADVVLSGWPIFTILGILSEETRRISFPLYSACDDLDATGGFVSSFLEDLSRALANNWRLPGDQALRLLEREEAGCPFAIAAAHFTLGSSGIGPDGSRRIGSPRAHLQAGQMALLQGWKPLGFSLYDLIVTRWPIWRALERFVRHDVPLSEMPSRRTTVAELVICGHGWSAFHAVVSSFSKASSWNLHFLRADADACPAFYLEVAESLPDDAIVIVTSPLIFAWNDHTETALTEIVELLRDDPGMEVVGLPTVDSQGFWTMNVWKLLLEDWELAYEAFPTGYTFARGDRCFIAEATSGTRGFARAETWRRLQQRVDGTSAMAGPAAGVGWLVDLDLQIRHMGLSVFTCIMAPAREENYLNIVTLTSGLSRRYQLEVARFSSTNEGRSCIDIDGWDRASSALFGVAPPCLEEEARSALRCALEGAGEGAALSIEPSSSSAALLLTRGRRVLWQLRDDRTSFVPLSVCCSVAVGGKDSACSFWRVAESTLEVPPELRIHFSMSRNALLFLSARLGEVVAELSDCQDASSEHFGVARLVDLLGMPPLELRTRPGRGLVPSMLPPPLSHVEVLLCCQQAGVLEAVRRFTTEHGWAMHSAVMDASDCPAFLRQAVSHVQDQNAVLLLSPLLWHWDANVGEAILQGLSSFVEHADAHVLGFPSIDKQGQWSSNLWQIRHQYWKLMYSSPRDMLRFRTPSGGRGAPAAGSLDRDDGHEDGLICATGDVASATRLFRNASLLKSAISRTQHDPTNPLNWLVDLDMQMYADSLCILVCMTLPLPEADYLSRVSLSTYLADKYQVEVALFGHRRFEHCLPGSNWFQVAKKGLVAPWCFRRDVEKAFRDVHDWWLAMDPDHNFVVPEEGTLLALFRNGAAGMLPWDSDFDAKFYTDLPMTVQEFMNRTREAAFAELEIEAYAYRGCGQDSYVLLRRPNITHHMADLYVAGNQSMVDHPWRARLFGVGVRLSPEHLEHIFFTRYRTPVRKLFGGDGISLRCFLPGHNACLPDCRDEQAPCEFEDEFVHVHNFVPRRNSHPEM
eukprot:TRINITY_DN37574_c0_g1_i1.p1 TRINITY_DN37574_c0_g1~~TRINITY_DN37574_c0_g1_i1.p1  ORF type:complete len:1166 (-),score=166.04 TRINITY_DN37574_c0_g1_i1:150-3647(-)